MDFLKESLELIKNPYLITIVLVTALFITATQKGWNKSISNIDWIKLLKGNKFKYKISDLEKHDLFIDIEEHKSFSPQFKTHGKKDSVKSRVFKDFLDVKLTSTSVNMKRICQGADNEMSRIELKYHIKQCFNSCNIELEMNLERRFIEKGLTKKEADLVIGKFFSVRNLAIDRYNKRIESIFSCDFYENNFQLILALYEVIAYELDDIIKDSISTFEDINGLFLNMSYE